MVMDPERFPDINEFIKFLFTVKRVIDMFGKDLTKQILEQIQKIRVAGHERQAGELEWMLEYAVSKERFMEYYEGEVSLFKRDLLGSMKPEDADRWNDGFGTNEKAFRGP